MPADPRSQHRIWRRRWQQEACCTKYITTSWKELQQTNHTIPEEGKLPMPKLIIQPTLPGNNRRQKKKDAKLQQQTRGKGMTS